MKTICVALLFMLTTLVFFSCSDDDDKFGFYRLNASGKPERLSDLEIPIGTTDIYIRGGHGDHEVSSGDMSIVDIYAYDSSKELVTIAGVSLGTTKLTIKDAMGNTVDLLVTVVEEKEKLHVKGSSH